MTEAIVPVRTYVLVFAALLALLGLTVFAARTDLGPFGLFAALAIATVKALLVLLYFMHVKFESRLVWVFATGAFFWLGLLLVLTMNDYLTRGWLAER